MTTPRIAVIGLGQDGPAGLAPDARAVIAAAGVLAGGRRHLGFFADWVGTRIVIDGDIAGFLEHLRAASVQAPAVVLASGDPLFYGIGRALLGAFPREALTFLPHVSSIPLAFARIKEPWDDARVVSLHGRPLAALVPELQALAPKIAVFTDPTNTPAAIAYLVVGLGLAAAYRVWVAEELGGPGERVTSWTPAEACEQAFGPLNVVVLRRTDEVAPPALPVVGLPDAAIRHAPGRQGMITKREVRLITLAYLGLRPGDLLWDVGAGSGSIALEAARLAPGLTAYAIERDPAAYRDIVVNSRALGTPGVRAVLAEAPAAFAALPDPDAVFIGGSGGHLAAIVIAALARLRPGGRIVVNCVTIETFASGWDLLAAAGLDPAATSVQLAHSRPVGSLHRFEPATPIFILQATKS